MSQKRKAAIDAVKRIRQFAGLDHGIFEFPDENLTPEEERKVLGVIKVLAINGYLAGFGSDDINAIRADFGASIAKILLADSVWKGVLEKERNLFYHYCLKYGNKVFKYMSKTQHALKMAQRYDMRINELYWYLLFQASRTLFETGGWFEEWPEHKSISPPTRTARAVFLGWTTYITCQRWESELFLHPVDGTTYDESDLISVGAVEKRILEDRISFKFLYEVETVLFEDGYFYVRTEKAIFRITESGDVTEIRGDPNNLLDFSLSYTKNYFVLGTPEQDVDIDERIFIYKLDEKTLERHDTLKASTLVSGDQYLPIEVKLDYQYAYEKYPSVVEVAVEMGMPASVQGKVYTLEKTNESMKYTFAGDDYVSGYRNEISTQMIVTPFNWTPTFSLDDIDYTKTSYYPRKETSTIFKSVYLEPKPDRNYALFEREGFGNFHLLCQVKVDTTYDGVYYSQVTERGSPWKPAPQYETFVSIKKRWEGALPAEVDAKLLRREAKLNSNYQKNCAQCGETANFKCECGVKYCSEACYDEALDEHLSFCFVH